MQSISNCFHGICVHVINELTQLMGSIARIRTFYRFTGSRTFCLIIISVGVLWNLVLYMCIISGLMSEEGVKLDNILKTLMFNCHRDRLPRMRGVKLDHILKSLMLIVTATGCHDCLLMALSFIYRKPITPSLFHTLCRHPFKSDSTASGHSTYTYLTVSTLRNKQHHFVCILLPTRVFNLVPILSVLLPLKSAQTVCGCIV